MGVAHYNGSQEEKQNTNICQDFQILNTVTRKDYFPLPFIDSI
jgi:hypothetical protein